MLNLTQVEEGPGDAGQKDEENQRRTTAPQKKLGYWERLALLKQAEKNEARRLREEAEAADAEMARWIDQDLPEIKNETKKMKKATGADE